MDSSPDNLDDSTTLEGKLNKDILAEQTHMLFDAMPLSIFAIVVNATILALVQAQVLGYQITIPWLVAVLCITAVRAWLTYKYKTTAPDSEQAHLWLRYFMLGVISSSIVWGAAGVMLFPADDPPHQVFLAFVIAGMSAGAVTSLSFNKYPIQIFLFCLLIPLAVRFFYEENLMANIMGAMTLLFLLIVFISSQRINANFLQNIQLRFAAAKREKQLTESEEKLRLVFDSAPLGILHYQNNGIVLDCNDIFLDIIDASRDKVINKGLFQIISDAELRQAFLDGFDKGIGHYEGNASSFSGHADKPVQVSFSAIRSDGEILGGVAVVEDITERKRVDKLKDEFISTVSHELRTPLTSILGSLGLLAGGVTEDMGEKSRELITIAKNNSDRLIRIINDILDISKIEAGKMSLHKQPVNVDQFLRQAIAENRIFASQHGIKLEYINNTEDCCVDIDSDRMMQVINNLLSNAVKFSAHGSSIEIEAQASAEKVMLSVRDYGEGIEEKFHDKLFEKFTQSDATDSRRVGGTGLGLSIVKAIVENHGGVINFESYKDIGTKFYIYLPMVECK